MSNNTHSRAATARRAVAGACVFVGLFVTFFGLGYEKISVVLAGVALLLLSVSGRLVTTLRGTVRQWVVGTGRVVQVSDPPPSAPYGRCQLELVIHVPGLPRDAVLLREPRVPVDRWPRPGQILPIEVAADDIRNVRILWQDYEQDEVVAAAEPPEEWDAPPAGVDPEGIDFDLDGPPTTPTSAAGGTRVPRPRPQPTPHAGARAGGTATATLADLPTVPVPAPTAGEDADRAAAGGDADRAAAGGDAEPATADQPDTAAHRAVRGVGATLLVTNLDRSVEFYRDLLGLQVVDRGGRSVVLASAGVRLVLRSSRQMDRVRRRVVHLHLEVGDVDSAYVALRSAGVRFIYPPRVVTRGSQLEQWGAMLRDPDGHGIALTQWRPAR